MTTRHDARYVQDAENHLAVPERDDYVRTFLRLLRSSDIVGRYADMAADEIWGGNRTTLAIVGTLLRYPEGIPQKDIARSIFLSKQATTLALDSLEEKGFIEKIADAKDRRVNTIRLTRKGADHFHETAPAMRAKCYEAMSVVNETELNQLYNILTKLAPMLRERIEKAQADGTQEPNPNV